MSARPALAQRAVKRSIDIVVSSVLLIATLPVIVLACAAIMLVDGWPVFFVQSREGRDGRRVAVVKLRTMRRDADHHLQSLLRSDADARRQWERSGGLRDDPRVLGALGRLLRRSSVDELPQLLQVVAGTMSLVGPRPLDPLLVPLLDDDALAVRRRVRPGLSGPWQVSGRSNLDLDELTRLDREFVEHWTLGRDLRVLVRTPRAVIAGSGAR